MKITKFGQSCLLVESPAARILIDPGSFFAAKHSAAELGKIDAVLVSHEHADHLHKDTISQIRNAGARVYTNESAARLVGEPVEIISDGDVFRVADLEIKVIELPHCQLVNQSEPPLNVGFLINNNLFHPGDGVEKQGLQVQNLAVPIAGPSISALTAATFARSVGAKKVIPIHYDFFLEDPKVFKAQFSEAEVIVLGEGESIEI